MGTANGLITTLVVVLTAVLTWLTRPPPFRPLFPEGRDPDCPRPPGRRALTSFRAQRVGLGCWHVHAGPAANVSTV